MAKRKRNPKGEDLLLYAGVGLVVGLLVKGDRQKAALGSAVAPALLAVGQGKQEDAVVAALAGFGGGLVGGAVGQTSSDWPEIRSHIWTEIPPKKEWVI